MGKLDEKIVSFKLDNRNFEQNAKQSLGTLENIKKALNFSKQAKDIKNFEQTANSVDLTPLAKMADTIQRRFSIMGEMGAAYVHKFANTVSNTVNKIHQEFTRPVTTGFSELETKMGSIQTILSNTRSKGSTLEDVNNALNDLNKYSDQTIYNFSEMTRNIGTFTAAGVGLEDSTKSIKGIANLAAVSGSTSVQASTAMYQLSQALAAGKVGLMDWNSVVNAGMGGEVFKNALMRTSRHLKTGVDAQIKANGSFRESLKDGWMTSEVLLETLKQISGEYTDAELKAQGYSAAQIKEIQALAADAVDAATKVKTLSQLIDTSREALQSGWAESWELIIGDFKEARDLFTDISNYIGAHISRMSEKRNRMLRGWRSMGGRDDVIQGVKNLVRAIENVVEPIRRAWRVVMPTKPMARTLFTITHKFEEFTRKLILNKDGMQKLFEVSKAFFSGILSAITLVKNITTGIRDFMAEFSPITTLFEYVKGVVESIANSDTEAAVTSLSDAFGNIFFVLQKVIPYVALFLNTLGSTFITKISAVSSATMAALWMFLKSGEIFGPQIIRLATQLAADITVAFLETLTENADRIVVALFDLSVAILTALGDYFNENSDILSTALSGVVTGVITTTAKTIKNIIVDTFNALNTIDPIAGVFSKIEEGFTKLRDFFVNDDPETIVGKVSTAISNAEDSVANFANSVSERKTEIATAFKEIHEAVKDPTTAIGNKYDSLKKRFDAFMDKESTITVINTLKRYAKGAWTIVDTIAKTIKNLVVGIGNSVEKMSKGDNMLFYITSIIKQLGTAALNFNLGAFLKALPGSISTASGSISASFNALKTIFADFKEGIDKLLNVDAEKTARKVELLKQLAISMAIVAGAIALLSLIPKERLVQSSIVVGVLLSVLGLLSTIVPAVINKLNTSLTGEKLISVGVFIGLLSTSLLVIAGAIAKLAAIPVDKADDIVTYSVALGVLFAELAGFAAMVQHIDSVTFTNVAAGCIVLSIAMRLLVGALVKLTKVKDPNMLGTAIVIMGILLAEIGLFIKHTPAADISSTALGMIAMGVALRVMVTAISKMTRVISDAVSAGSIKSLIAGFVLMTAVLAEMAIFTRFTNSVDLMSTGLGMVAIAFALGVFAKSIGKFTELFEEQSLLATIAAFAVIRQSFVPALIAIFAISEFAKPSKLFGTAAALIVFGGAIAIMSSVISHIGKNGGDFAKGAVAIGILAAALVGLGAIASYTGAGTGIAIIAASLLSIGVSAMLVAGSVTLLASGIVKLAKAIVMFSELSAPTIEQFGDKVALFIETTGPKIIRAIGQAILKSALYILEFLGQAIAILIANGSILITNLLDGLAMYAPVFYEWLSNTFSNVWKWIKEKIEYFSDEENRREFTQKIIEKLVTFIGDLLIGAVNGLTKVLPDLVVALLDLVVEIINKLAEYLDKNGDKVIEAFTNLFNSLVRFFFKAQRAIIPTILKTAVDVGKDFMESGIGQGIKDAFDKIKDIFFDLVDSIGGWIQEKWDALTGFGNDIIAGISEGIEKAKQWFGQKWDAFSGWMQDTFGDDNEMQSPSKVYKRFGNYLVEGLSNGITENSFKPVEAITSLSDKLKTVVTSMLADSIPEDSFSIDPMVRPHLDLSNMRTTDLSRYLSADKTIALSAGINGNMSSSYGNNGTMNGTYVFNQYNNSPKSLDDIEIYRNTQRQLTMFKEANKTK